MNNDNSSEKISLSEFLKLIFGDSEESNIRIKMIDLIKLINVKCLSLIQNIISFLFHKNKIRENIFTDNNSLNIFSFFSKTNYQKGVQA